jgi:hypothetical protein
LSAFEGFGWHGRSPFQLNLLDFEIYVYQIIFPDGTVFVVMILQTKIQFFRCKTESD